MFEAGETIASYLMSAHMPSHIKFTCLAANITIMPVVVVVVVVHEVSLF